MNCGYASIPSTSAYMRSALYGNRTDFLTLAI
jgi:hypothetical protein